MLIRLLPLLVGVLPVVAVFGAYWLGVQHEILPECNPWLDGCTSISSAGRHPPGSYLFRAVQLPSAALLAVIWFFCKEWLTQLNHGAFANRSNVMFVSGAIGSLALVLYVTFLGTTEPFYGFMRRFGVYFYFLGTVIAQLLLSLTLANYAKTQTVSSLGRLPRLMLVLVALPFVLGILNLILKATLDDADAFENSIEWIASLSMQAWFVLLYFAWRRTGFDVFVGVRE